MRRLLLALTFAALPANAEQTETSVIGMVQGPHAGPAEALVVVDFFFAPQSRTQAYRRLQTLMQRHPDEMLVRFHPVPYVANQRDLFAEALFEAHDQGKFTAYLEELNRTSNRRQPKMVAKQIARSVGMDMRRLDRAFVTGAHTKVVAQHQKLRQQLRASRLPSIVFNGHTRSTGYSPNMRLLEDIFQRELKSAERFSREGKSRQEIFDLARRRSLLSEPNVIIRQGHVDGRAGREAHEPEKVPKFARYKPSEWLWLTRNEGPTVFLFCRYRSVQCRRQYQTLMSLASTKSISVVFAPVGTADSADKESFAQALCANELGQLMTYHQAAMTAGRYPTEYALRRLGPLRQQLADCAKRKTVTQRVERLVKASKKAGMNDSPSILIGARKLVGTKANDEIRTILRDEFGPGLLEQLSMD